MPEEETIPDPAYAEKLALIEDETNSKVSHTMSAIESAVAAWDAAGKRPPELEAQIKSLQRFYDQLVEWEINSLRSKKDKDLQARIERLRAYVLICADYEKGKGN